MTEVRVVVVDDQALVRVGLCGIVATGDGLTVVGEAADGLAAVDVVTRLVPDVVLMDIRMPVLDGIEATRRITAATASRVLILTTFDLDEYVYGALRAGASGFLLKDAPPEDLHAAIRVIAAGDALLAPGVTRRLIATFAALSAASMDPAPVDPAPVPPAPRPAPDPLGGLTDRERQVLALVAEGLTNAEIGLRLHITAGTAKTHVARLLHKLDARDRIQLVIVAHRAGLAP